MAAELEDARGCLSEAGVLAFRAAPPGRAPAELAVHLAACGRCQERLLAADGPRGRRQRPPPWRVFVLFFGGLLITFLLYAWTRRLLGTGL